MKPAASLPLSNQLMLVVAGTACLLLVPFIAMRFTGEVAWDTVDFLVAGLLLAGTGVSYVIAARWAASRRARIAIGFALAALLFLVWAELAVGVFGTPFAGS